MKARSIMGPRAALPRVQSLMIVGVLLLLAGSTLEGCSPDGFPEVLPSDTGDRAWARQVVPILFGRKVKGYTEVKLLADLVALTDRQTVLRGLMEQGEFVDHWSEVMVDMLRVDREADYASGPAQSDCFGPALRSGPPTAALAQHIVASPTSSPAPAARST